MARASKSVVKAAFTNEYLNSKALKAYLKPIEKQLKAQQKQIAKLEKQIEKLIGKKKSKVEKSI